MPAKHLLDQSTPPLFHVLEEYWFKELYLDLKVTAIKKMEEKMLIAIVLDRPLVEGCCFFPLRKCIFYFRNGKKQQPGVPADAPAAAETEAATDPLPTAVSTTHEGAAKDDILLCKLVE